MSTKIDVVKAYIEAANGGDAEKAGAFLADDFEFSGPVPEPMGKMAYIGLTKNNVVAFPDWTFHASDFAEDGDVVTLALRITGTHTGDLDLSGMGMSVIPATGKSFDLPPESGKWTVVDGKITSLRTEPNPQNGMMGILSQLGINPPS